MKNKITKFLLFTLGDKIFAFNVEDVYRVIELVEITPLPESPRKILGIINLHGEIIAIGDIKRKLNIKPEKFSLDNCIVIVRYKGKKLGFVIDKLIGYKEIAPEDFISGEEIMSELSDVKGIVKMDSDIILINNIENFMDDYEENWTQDAINNLV